jgi:hypothetical protein
MTVERRIKSELPSILDQFARRLESGMPRTEDARGRS